MPFHSVQGSSMAATFALAAHMMWCPRQRHLDAGLEVMMMQDVDDQSLPACRPALQLLTCHTEPTNYYPSSMFEVVARTSGRYHSDVVRRRGRGAPTMARLTGFCLVLAALPPAVPPLAVVLKGNSPMQPHLKTTLSDCRGELP